MSVLNTVFVASDGTVSWNGSKVSWPTFVEYLKASRELHPVPITRIEFGEEVDCDTVGRFRRLLIQTLDCGSGRCMEGAGKVWLVGDALFDGKASPPFDPSPKNAALVGDAAEGRKISVK